MQASADPFFIKTEETKEEGHGKQVPAFISISGGGPSGPKHHKSSRGESRDYDKEL